MPNVTFTSLSNNPPPTPPLPVSPTPTSAENSENWIQNLAIVFADKGKNDTLPS